MNEPVPIADDGRTIFVGSFDDSTIYTYALPLAPQSVDGPADASPSAPFVRPFSGSVRTNRRPAALSNRCFRAGVQDPSGLAVSRGYLYVAGASPVGAGNGEVLAYKLPLVAHEKPSASITDYPVDFLSLAAQGDKLYVASTTTGTVRAYRLPLRQGESPEFTIHMKAQDDGATGVAVDPQSNHLYVSLYAFGTIYEYRLPYRTGESPAILNVRSPSGQGPYGIAVGDGHLFTTAGSILSYRLPLAAHPKPQVALPFKGSTLAAGLAVGK